MEPGVPSWTLPAPCMAFMWLFSLFTATNCRLQRLHCWGLMSKCCHLKERFYKRRKCLVHLCRTREFLCLKNVPHSSHFHFFSVLCTFMCTCRVLYWQVRTSSSPTLISVTSAEQWRHPHSRTPATTNWGIYARNLQEGRSSKGLRPSPRSFFALKPLKSFFLLLLF